MGDDGMPRMNRIPNKIIQFSLESLFFLILSASLDAQERCTTEVFAGTGVAGYSPTQDGGPATAARLNNPLGVAVDSLGRVFIADSTNYRIRMVVPETGIISTVAGAGTTWPGSMGFGGPATRAWVYEPSRVAVDSLDRVYISAPDRIWRFVPGGTIDNIVGTGVAGFYGDGGAAILSRLDGPSGMAFDASDNLYLADRDNHRIRIITNPPAGLHIDTLAGSGDSTPAGVTPANGLAEDITFNFPRGVAVDNNGNILLADTYDDIVWRVYRSGPQAGEIERMAGRHGYFFGGDNGPTIDAGMFHPADLDVDGAGIIYIADTLNDRIRRISPDGTISTIVGPESGTDLNRPEDIVVTSDGLFYIADTGNHRILRGRCVTMGAARRGDRVFVARPAGGSAGPGGADDDGGGGPGGGGPGGADDGDGGARPGGAGPGGDDGADDGGATDLTLGTAVGGDGLSDIPRAGGSGSETVGASDVTTVTTAGAPTSFFQGDPEQSGAVAQFRSSPGGGSGSEASGSGDGAGEGEGEGEGSGIGSGQGAGGGTTGSGSGCSLMR